MGRLAAYPTSYRCSIFPQTPLPALVGNVSQRSTTYRGNRSRGRSGGELDRSALGYHRQDKVANDSLVFRVIAVNKIVGLGGEVGGDAEVPIAGCEGEIWTHPVVGHLWNQPGHGPQALRDGFNLCRFGFFYEAEENEVAQ